VKPYARYHQSITSQQEPDFYTVVAGIPMSPSDGFNISLNDDHGNFTLASGLKSGLAAGYIFKNNFGVDLSADFFNQQKDFVFLDNGYSKATTSWSYRTTTLRPAFTFTIDNKKSSFIGKTGPVLVLANGEKSTHIISNDNDSKLATCTFNPNVNLGYNVGFEYNYHLSESFALALELGLEQYNYTPTKSKVQYAGIESIEVNGQQKKVLEIKYVSKINHVETYYGYPNVRFKKSILFNSLYFGMGIKYNIGSK
jgi:hypothetical protein